MGIKTLLLWALTIPLAVSCANEGGVSHIRYGLKENAVAELSLFAFNGDSERVPLTVNLGHAFVTLENTGSEPLKFGAAQLAVHESVSLGSWSMSAHFGFWYNVESTYVNEFERYEGRVSLKTQIDTADLANINDYIEDHDYWTLLKNCSFMALDIYNLAAEESDRLPVPALVTPQAIDTLIRSTTGYEVNQGIDNYGSVGYARDAEMTGLVEYHV